MTIYTNVTFTAVFQVPGEYEDETGLAVLRKNKNFQTFLIFDCLAFGTSAVGNVHPLCVYNFSRYKISSPRGYAEMLQVPLVEFSIFWMIVAFYGSVRSVLEEDDPSNLASWVMLYLWPVWKIKNGGRVE